MKAVEQLVGGAVLLVALADVFLTVLYARKDTGLIAMPYARAIEKTWVSVSRAFGRSRGKFVSFCGPVTLLGVLGLWTGLLVLGSALAVHPALGAAVRPSSGSANTDFVTALFVGGASVSVVGSSGYSPQTTAYRLFFLFNSAVGMAMVSLVLTFLGQVYGALLRRNALALEIHAMTEEKGDAAELLCRLFPRGETSAGTSAIAELGSEMAAVKEAHHFYPLLAHFRFEEPFYSVSRMASISLDAMSLVMSSLDEEKFGAVKESYGVTLLWRSSMWIVSTLRRDAPAESEAPSARDLVVWRRRHRAALARLRAAGIATAADEEGSFERYADLRARWDGHVRALAPSLALSMDEVDEPAELAARRTSLST